MDGGTGLSRNPISKGIKRAIEHGFLEVEEDNRDLARRKRFYSIKLKDTPTKKKKPVDYYEYIKSDKWKKKAKKAKIRAGWKCQLCSTKDEQLDCHHNNYENLGNELDTDLFVICNPCHGKFHGKDEVIK